MNFGEGRPGIAMPVNIAHHAGGARYRCSLLQVIEKSIDAADESVLLTTAYFFPPGFLKTALMRVPARGARLSLLLSGSSDFYPLPGDLLAQTHFLRNFLRDTPSQRVKVHLYGHRHMHAKHMRLGPDSEEFPSSF